MRNESITCEFLATLEVAAAYLNEAGVAWMVFGGAAMALHGFGEDPVADIDIILTGPAAADLCQRHAWQNHADGASLFFRSDTLLRPDFGPVPVELLGNFRIWDGSAWIAVEPNGATDLKVGSQIVYLPTREQLAKIFRLCGREKDLQRAALIEHA